MFEHLFTSDSINIHFKEWVEQIHRTPTWYRIETSTWSYEVDKVVLTTWWNAYSHTWSSGDGYAFAASLWHTITPLWPSLNSFVTKQEWIHSLSGLSFPDATAHITIQWQRNKKSWPILITHFWISGPLTFIIASLSAFEPITSEQPFAVRLQPHADIQEQEWHDYLLYSSQASKKEILTILSSKLPRRFCEALLQEISIQNNLPVSQLTKKQRQTLSNRLWQGIPLHLIKRRPGDEFVTAGWVDTSQVDPHTLESKISPWLYFAGEILNIDGVTGGYNLQMCWSTGRSVGMGI
jgi:predicted Rossmann fold flavoprotein